MVNGQLKNKYRCLLGQGLQLTPKRACDVIVAYCVLFNMSKLFKEPEEDIEVELPQIDHEINDEGNLAGLDIRNEIVNNLYFIYSDWMVQLYCTVTL